MHGIAGKSPASLASLGETTAPLVVRCQEGCFCMKWLCAHVTAMEGVSTTHPHWTRQARGGSECGQCLKGGPSGAGPSPCAKGLALAQDLLFLAVCGFLSNRRGHLYLTITYRDGRGRTSRAVSAMCADGVGSSGSCPSDGIHTLSQGL